MQASGKSSILTQYRKNHPPGNISTGLAVIIIISSLLLSVLALAGCGTGDSQSDIDQWISQLASEDEAQRQEAVDQLIQAGEPAVDPVIEVFTGDNQELEFLKAASDVLAGIGEPAVEPLIISFTYQGERSATALAWKKTTLAAIGEPAIDPLITALSDEDPVVRAAAADSLGKAGEVRAITPLSALVNDGEENVRESLAIALGVMEAPEGILPLAQLLQDEQWPVRNAARKSLIQIRRAVGMDPRLQTAFDTCVAVDVAPSTDPLGLVIDPNGVMTNPEVLKVLTDDQKLNILEALGDCVGILRDSQ